MRSSVAVLIITALLLPFGCGAEEEAGGGGVCALVGGSCPSGATCRPETGDPILFDLGTSPDGRCLPPSELDGPCVDDDDCIDGTRCGQPQQFLGEIRPARCQLDK